MYSNKKQFWKSYNPTNGQFLPNQVLTSSRWYDIEKPLFEQKNCNQQKSSQAEIKMKGNIKVLAVLESYFQKWPNCIQIQLYTFFLYSCIENDLTGTYYQKLHSCWIMDRPIILYRFKPHLAEYLTAKCKLRPNLGMRPSAFLRRRPRQSGSNA